VVLRFTAQLKGKRLAVEEEATSSEKPRVSLKFTVPLPYRLSQQ